MPKPIYCVVVYEIDFLYYHLLLVRLDETGKDQHAIMEQVSNVSEDVASMYMSAFIKDYQLNDSVQVVDRIYKDGMHKQTIYETVGKFKEIYEVV